MNGYALSRKISLKGVALAAGVSRSTASRAFKPELPVSGKVRRKVLAAAARLGYVPDPGVSSVMSGCRRSAAVSFRETLGVVWCHQPGTWSGKTSQLIERMRIHAFGRGYHLDEFSLYSPGMSVERLDNMLCARGIRGIILGPPINTPRPRLKLDWAKYAAVTVGSSLWEPRLYRIHQHHFMAMVVALENILGLGYRRPLLLLPKHFHERTTRSYLGALRAFGPETGTNNLDFLIFEDTHEKGLPACIQNSGCDILITIWDLANHAKALAMPFALLDTPMGQTAIAGVSFEDRSYIRSVDMVLDLLTRREFGLPANAEDVMIEGHWRDGLSAPSV